MFGCLVRFGSLRRSVLSMLQQHFMLLPPWQQGQHWRTVTVASVASVAWSYWCPILQLLKDGSNHLCTASTVPSRICKHPWQTRANSSYVWLILLYQLYHILLHDSKCNLITCFRHRVSMLGNMPVYFSMGIPQCHKQHRMPRCLPSLFLWFYTDGPWLLQWQLGRMPATAAYSRMMSLLSMLIRSN